MGKIKIYLKEVGIINEKLIPFPELEKINNYKSSSKRKESLTALSLLGEVLQEKGILSYQLSYQDQGKPFLKDLPYHFNVSHSAGIVACVVEDEEIGIDLEKITKRIIKLKKKITKIEINQQKAAEQLTKIWVLKEALVKYLGIGLTIPLKEIKIESSKEGYYQVNYLDQKAECKLLKYQDYYLACCVAEIANVELEIVER